METKTELKRKVNNRLIFNRWQQTGHQMIAHVAQCLVEPALYRIMSNNSFTIPVNIKANVVRSSPGICVYGCL